LSGLLTSYIMKVNNFRWKRYKITCKSEYVWTNFVGLLGSFFSNSQ